MSSTKKKIYIAIIIICLGSTGAVLYFGFSSPSVPAPEVVLQPGNTSNPAGGNSGVVTTNAAGQKIYNSPSVFPNDTKFDWTLTNSDEFKKLNHVPDLTLDPSQVGRANPFNP